MSTIQSPYTIERLAPGSYDVLRDGSLVAGLVREVDSSDTTRGWVVELLDETPSGDLPAPFTAQRHAFGSLMAATSRLGIHADADRGSWRPPNPYGQSVRRQQNANGAIST